MQDTDQVQSGSAESWTDGISAGNSPLLRCIEPNQRCPVLVVEDQYVIALDLSEALERAGAQVLGPVATLDAAMRLLLRHDDIAGAVLDVTLQGAVVYSLAEALRRRGVPFVFSTGHPRERIPPAFRDTVLCEKPVAAAKVVQALQAEMARPNHPLAGPPIGVACRQD